MRVHDTETPTAPDQDAAHQGAECLVAEQEVRSICIVLIAIIRGE